MNATETGVRIAPLRPEHAEQVLTIYRLGTDERHAAFETTAPSRRAFDTAELPPTVWSPWTTADGCWAGRLRFRFPTGVRTPESSSTVHPEARGRGVEDLEPLTALPPPSALRATVGLALRRWAGFRVIGPRERIGATTAGAGAGCVRSPNRARAEAEEAIGSDDARIIGPRRPVRTRITGPGSSRRSSLATPCWTSTDRFRGAGIR
ncbi:GNAT family N-acetyltransferase [Streptomyces sp. NPDC088812]|uniref:GNAT family N-acetyltransferase n=1 Tax=Streptomyces sp. NPDC088812 TaxID=3365905 RepID=UPI003800FD72